MPRTERDGSRKRERVVTGLFDTDDPTRLWVGLTIGYFPIGIAVTVWLSRRGTGLELDGSRSTMGFDERILAAGTLLWPLVLVAMLAGWLYRCVFGLARDLAQQSRDRRR